MPTFGEIVKQRRVELGMTQNELATKLGYKSRTTISRIEDGSRDVPQRQVMRIAEALQIDPASLIKQQISDREIVLQAESDLEFFAKYKALPEAQRKIIDDLIDQLSQK